MANIDIKAVDHSDAAPNALAVKAIFAPTINLAFYQNSVPALRELLIANESDSPLTQIELRLQSEPAFLAPKLWRIENIDPGQQYHLTDLDIELNGGLLAGLTEAVKAQATFILSASGSASVTTPYVIELLARNQWDGIGHVPELVAAFVQPNDPAVERILKQAASILRSSDRDSSLNGYADGSKQRVWELSAALWASVVQLSLDYALPPASFEKSGQKVRSPSQIVDAGLATCLDLTLLFAACLEQMGLNATIIFTEGHSFVGCWLKPEEFATATVDDVTALRKRIQLQELIVFETTLAAGEKRAHFKHAFERARLQLAPEEDAKFQLAIDLKRARQQRIRPLSASEASHTLPSVAQPDSAAAAVLEPAPDFEEDSTDSKKEEVDDSPAGRLERWKRQLLDLSLRNNLLNFKPAKRAVVLDAPDPSKLEDCLAEGKKLRIKARPVVMSGLDPRSEQLHLERHKEVVTREVAADALQKNEILVGLDESELDTRLVKLYRLSRTSLQEGGANTLFLALGFLCWKKSDAKDDRTYRAPLILIPVSLERKSVRTGFRLMLHEDEPRFNPTLVEMLRQDFSLHLPFGEQELPKDDSGLDVKLIWRTVAEKVKEVSGWEVSEDVVLSTFSFAKHLMWKDMVDRTDELKQNPVVRHLIETPRDPYPNDIPFPEAKQLDEICHPSKTFCPLPADSSQLAAIRAGASGKDFVLVGPPGTGKSQTISNLITQCLADGKTVLFVSEKIAALDVVYRRLKHVGLGDFCLELHSNKARKTEVLAQLRNSWERRQRRSISSWDRECTRLKKLRDQLNRFVHHLHRDHRNGLTARKAITRIVAGKDIPEIKFYWVSHECHSRDDVDRLRDIIDQIQALLAIVSVASDNPLQVVTRAEWTPKWQQSLVDAAEALRAAADKLNQEGRALLSRLDLSETQLKGGVRAGLVNLAEALPHAAGHDWRFVLRPNFKRTADRLRQGLQLLAERECKRSSLSISYPPELLEKEVQPLQALWNTAEDTWWPRSWFLRRQVRQELVQRAGGGKLRPDCAKDLELLAKIRELDRQIESLSDLADMTDGLWRGLPTDAAEVTAALDFAARVLTGVKSLAPDSAGLKALRDALLRLLGEGNALLEPGAVVANECRRWLDAHNHFKSVEPRFIELSGGGELVQQCGQRDLESIDRFASGVIAHQNRLNNWCAWRRVRHEALALGLAPLIDALESGGADHVRLSQTFDVNYCRWWLAELVEVDPVLRTFVSAEHERVIDEFRTLDDKLMELTRDYVRSKLCSEMPDPDDIKRGSEWGILKREIEKRTRHMPLRQLVTSLPTVLTKLSPCLLMSPLSIAQYLPTGQSQFDLVVFDEASQIPVWDAVGAIARGKQSVIVGDPKQLPPTSFFDRAREEDEDVVEDVDLESILDECAGANVPALRLNWHYRSRYESLIAFSNHRYYDGDLVTFPSPVVEDMAVSFHHVAEGVYEKGGARINQLEAKALVEEVVSRVKDPTFNEGGQTIGIVTFNSEQQKLIEDLLDAERAADPNIEKHFSEDNLEALFVKNLENVQGDERDIMYFSITYGPDRAGKVSLNFGPLNNEGGERRLNVAITRARHELRVFSSLLPDHIDLSRTKAVGVRDLKDFLNFAIKGPRALAEAMSRPGGDFESDFEKAVASALASRGWTVHPQIGVSGFRIDLGVVHPERPGAYLAGIECDGATYHRSATARDRDKLREQVLRGLGWEILRIWSPDWWMDAPGTTTKIHAQLERLLSDSRNTSRGKDEMY